MDNIRKIPKIDLHCHLDGSLSFASVKKLALDPQAPPLPDTEAELRDKLIVPPSCKSLAEYLERFALPLNYLCSKENFTRAVYQLMKEAYREGVIYQEVRFAPLLSVREGLTERDIIEGAITGMRRAEQDFPVRGNIIVCFMRHEDVAENLRFLDTVEPYVGYGVCAVDTAGDEAAFPMSVQQELFREAYKRKIPFTIHAGECGDPDNIEAAVQLGARRIGHGIAMIDRPDVRRLCRKHRIGIEMCPTSNFQTRAVSGVEEYPINLFVQEGLLVTVNTDNRTVSNTNMTKELLLVREKFGLDPMLFAKNAIEVSFAADEVKQWMWNQIK